MTTLEALEAFYKAYHNTNIFVVDGSFLVIGKIPYGRNKSVVKSAEKIIQKLQLPLKVKGNNSVLFCDSVVVEGKN